MRARGWKPMIPWWAIAGLAVVMLAVIIQPWNLLRQGEDVSPRAEGDLEENAAESLSQGGLVERGAILNQTLDYKRCGHTVQRRVEAPVELLGLDRKGIENALPNYRVTAYGGKEIAMQRELEMFCPDHWVLMPDAQGELCVWQNLLGEEMVCQRELGIGVEDVPEDERASVRAGKAFDTLEDLEGWLESADS